MSRIGIITLYYDNENYGGLLQAYALVHYLQQKGYQAEQIAWDFHEGLDRTKQQDTIVPHRKSAQLKVFAKSIVRWAEKKNLAKRKNAFKEFELSIPHSKKTYTSSTIQETVKIYQIFITGSDQVWNMDWYNPENFLGFVNGLTSKKISYAASMPNIHITDNEKEIVKKHLEDFCGISVRENGTRDFLSNLTGKKIELVVDPTLLLDSEDWKSIIQKYQVKEKYIFCYFIGGNSKVRRIADKFAKMLGIHIVNLPYVGGINFSDIVFGDKKIYDVSPGQFIYLIQNAEYVLTDSFHAVVFANIFGTKYYAFGRAGGEEMNARLISLLDMFGEMKRFCQGSKFSCEYMFQIRNEIVSYKTDQFIKARKSSEAFLSTHLAESN